MAPTTTAAPKHAAEARAADSARKKEILAALCCKSKPGVPQWMRRVGIEPPAAAAATNAAIVDPTAPGRQIHSEMVRCYRWRSRRRERMLAQGHRSFMREVSMRAAWKEPTARVHCATEDRLAAMMEDLTTTASAGGGGGDDRHLQQLEGMEVPSNSKTE